MFCIQLNKRVDHWALKPYCTVNCIQPTVHCILYITQHYPKLHHTTLINVLYSPCEGRGHTDLAVLKQIEISLVVYLLCFEAGPERLISFSEIVPKTSHLGSEEDMYPVE